MNYSSRFLSSIRSISFRAEELTNSETDLKPNSEYFSIKFLMLKNSSSGIFTSLYVFAMNVSYYKSIKKILDIYGEIFIIKKVFRHICLTRGAEYESLERH
ncbi:hypothetical protein FACI_IFERC00001G1400 [Ferroplasma acidarmanus Fer1]|uniref:Uncharacterized protein n=1 Tax=Ferroplasma acidarmanus Fer1 TaxID=333146 RepID=S0ATF8_FERAC|nr:hypothetical protein FACI_IFERC00001G1400 [Ferroplasma acidarmanus Fer1]